MAKHMNKTLLERTRSMLNNSNLCQELWAKAVSTACYLINRSLLVASYCKIPEEVWTSHPCDYSNLNFFGCEAYSLTP